MRGVLLKQKVMWNVDRRHQTDIAEITSWMSSGVTDLGGCFQSIYILQSSEILKGV